MTKPPAAAQSTPLAQYYDSVKLSPVEHDLTRADTLRTHLRKRQNLLDHYLKMPAQLWRGARVLEFGPGSGENAAVLAHYGARLTLVEPLDYLIQKLKANFQKLGLAAQIEALYQEALEHFECSQTFEFVVAEGFIHFLEDKAAAVRKLCSLVAPEGFLFVSVVHPSGTFIEFFKKALLDRMIRQTGARAPDQRVTSARLLFYDDFSKTKHSRSFESWIGDTLLNPLYRMANFLDLAQVLDAAPADFQLYSAWPNCKSFDDLRWHKVILDVKQVRARTMDAYYARYPHFLHSIPASGSDYSPFSSERGRTLSRLIDLSLGALDRSLDSESGWDSDLAPSLRKLEKAARPLPEVGPLPQLLADCRDLVERTQHASGSAEFVNAYMASGLLKKNWGSPGHYYVLHRTSLFTG
jgi:SAM-dependent methyltransferase